MTILRRALVESGDILKGGYRTSSGRRGMNSVKSMFDLSISSSGVIMFFFFLPNSYSSSGWFLYLPLFLPIRCCILEKDLYLVINLNQSWFGMRLIFFYYKLDQIIQVISYKIVNCKSEEWYLKVAMIWERTHHKAKRNIWLPRTHITLFT